MQLIVLLQYYVSDGRKEYADVMALVDDLVPIWKKQWAQNGALFKVRFLVRCCDARFAESQVDVPQL